MISLGKNDKSLEMTTNWRIITMITSIHFLLSYMCNLDCDHCFVYSNPHAKGTFTLKQIRTIIDDARKIGSVEWVYFEGGEPFLFYPILMEAVKYANKNGFKTGNNRTNGRKYPIFGKLFG